MNRPLALGDFRKQKVRKAAAQQFTTDGMQPGTESPHAFKPAADSSEYCQDPNRPDRCLLIIFRDIC